MTDFFEQLAVGARSLGLGGRRILVGVSGGADSVALLCGLKHLEASIRMELHAAHLNHGLRPIAADEDAAWTEHFCRRMGVPAVVERIDVAEYARSLGSNLEAAARVVRYEFFERTARRLDCTHVAVAHSADDRVETVLHHLLRGTGLGGLAGMKASRPLGESLTLVRPLLTISRRDIEHFLAEIGQDFRTDATNADTDRTRSRIRHWLLPALEQEFGAHVRTSVLRLADAAEDAQSGIETLADRLLEQCLEDGSGEICRLKLDAMRGQPPHLVRELFVTLWKRKGWPRQRMGFDEWDRLAGLVNRGGTATLPGTIEATVRGSLLVLRPLGNLRDDSDQRSTDVGQNGDSAVEFGEKP
jgi:tRNA(Ile)-lysidine synthase